MARHSSFVPRTRNGVYFRYDIKENLLAFFRSWLGVDVV